MESHRWTFTQLSAPELGAPDLDRPASAQLTNVTVGAPGPSGGSFVVLKGYDSFVDFGKTVGQFGNANFTVALWVNTAETRSLFDIAGTGP